MAEKYGLNIDFRPFIQIDPVSAKEYRQSKINILDHTAIIFTSKTAVTHFFRLCKEMKITVPDSMKYFCISESTAFFLQKYIVYRKRKIFYANGTVNDLMDYIKKHSEEFFLVPCSDVHKDEIPSLLEKLRIKFTKTILYKTISSNLSDLKDFHYDILVFFSPKDIPSLKKNFPKFKQRDTKIAAFGPATTKAVIDAGLRLDIQAPLPEAPSMTMALDLFLKNYNKNNKK
ncbi:MAG: uroporphyrinogen-III synthase [Bacteroidia bacterium]|nr:uroporphyrinogen-III synthase [Bacteroidia bacterium]